VAAVARDLDLTASALRDWVIQARANRDGKSGLTSDERTELAALRKQVRELKMERDLLKMGRLLRQGKRVRYAFIEAEKATADKEFSVEYQRSSTKKNSLAESLMRDVVTRVVVDRVAIDAEKFGDLVGREDLRRRLYILHGWLQPSAGDVLQDLHSAAEDAECDQFHKLLRVTRNLDDATIVFVRVGGNLCKGALHDANLPSSSWRCARSHFAAASFESGSSSLTRSNASGEVELGNGWGTIRPP